MDRTRPAAMSACKASIAVISCVTVELEGGRDDPRFPGSDRRYANNKPEDLPLTESLKTTVDRFMPLWQDTIAPAVKSGKHVIIAAHGNSLRVSLHCPVLQTPTTVKRLDVLLARWNSRCCKLISVTFQFLHHCWHTCVL